MRVSPRRPRIGLWLLLAALGAGAPAQQDKALKKPRIPVFGVVRDTAGKPVAGATVREVRLALDGVDNLTATRLGLGVRHGAETTTNDRGKFVLRVAAHGTFGIVATKGNTRSQVIAPAAPAGSHELRLRELRTIKGRFVDVENGKELLPALHTVRSTGPLESAIPGAFPMRVFAMIEEVRTAADGTFTVKVLAGDSCHVTDASNNCRVAIPAEVTAPVVLRREVRTVQGQCWPSPTSSAPRTPASSR